MHADKREDIDAAEAGDIVAIMGLDCASGDTYASEPNYCTLESMFVAEPVIKMSINAVSRDGMPIDCAKALQRFRKEDPTFHVLHRRRDRAKPSSPAWASCTSKSTSSAFAASTRSKSKSALRRSATAKPRPKPTEFNHKHKKQTGGSGQYAHIVGMMGPMTDEEARRGRRASCCSSTRSSSGRIPKNFIPAVEKGFRNMMAKGPLAGFPVVGFKIDLQDGSYHDVDSSDMAFSLCAGLLPRRVPADEAGAARADHAGGNRSAPKPSKARWSAIFPRAAA